MAILNKSNTGYVGIRLPKPIYSYICLYALTKGVTKTDIIRDRMTSWYNDNRKTNYTEGILVADLIKKIQAEWKETKELTPKTSLDAFKNDLQNELKNKGIEKPIIHKILNALST